MAPVALRLEVAEVELLLQAPLDRCHRACDLARHEGFAPHRPFVVEKDAIRGMHTICLTIVDSDPVRIELCCGVWGTRVKRRRLALRHLLHFAVKLRRGGLVEACALLD